MSINHQSQFTLINYIKRKHSICHHIVIKLSQGQEVDFKSCLLSCYNLVNPNKSVHPIDLQNTNYFKEWIDYRDRSPLGKLRP